MGGGCAYPHPPAIREMRRLPNRMVPSDDALYMFREIVPRESGESYVPTPPDAPSRGCTPQGLLHQAAGCESTPPS